MKILEKNNIEIINKEVPFLLEEIFFSRTDERGIILSGNSVFQRISMYSWEELIKKPHNIIRHPDMPKTVFWLLWDTIKRNEPIGAYVKNRAKDGRFYWVFAIVTPIDGGYLSVRIKPTSAFLSVIEEEYKGLLSLENGIKFNVNEILPKLSLRLNELGFADYSEFMSDALAEEISARNKSLNKEKDQTISSFTELMNSAKSLLKNSENIFSSYEQNFYVPLNLRVQAAKLGNQGAMIGVISENYNIISSSLKDEMVQFTSSAKEVFDTINKARFLVCISKIQKEVVEVFEKETSSEFSKNQEMDLLKAQQNNYNSKAIESLNNIQNKIKNFKQDCENIKRLSSALEVTRVMGKVEASRINNSETCLNELIEDLENLQKSISGNLKNIEAMNNSIEHDMHNLLHIASYA